jgi:propionyl-CoA carboxylase beta chain
VIQAVTHERVTKEELGGAQAHASLSGVAHFSAPDDRQCLMGIRRLLSYLPSNNQEQPPMVLTSDPPDRLLADVAGLLPTASNQPYDVKQVIHRMLDDGDFLEVAADYARNIVVGLGRLGGHPVGVVGNQPMVLAGVLHIDASIKAARFVRFCDCFNIPIVTLVDVPGFLPGVDQEHRGIILHGAKLLFAYCEATVPKVTVIVRKAYGGAYDVMASKHTRADFNFAFPSAEVAVMGPEGAVNIVHRAEIAAAEDPRAAQERFVGEYREQFANPLKVAELGFVDEVIDPAELRKRLCQTLQLLRNKRQSSPNKKHGNIPL